MPLRFLIFTFHFVVARPDLRKISKYFAEMPTEEFLTRFMRSRAAGASMVVISDVVEKGPEAASKSALTAPEALGVTSPDSTIVLGKEKDRKRHRDGAASRTHHHKRFKEPAAH